MNDLQVFAVLLLWGTVLITGSALCAFEKDKIHRVGTAMVTCGFISMPVALVVIAVLLLAK